MYSENKQWQGQLLTTCVYKVFIIVIAIYSNRIYLSIISTVTLLVLVVVVLNWGTQKIAGKLQHQFQRIQVHGFKSQKSKV